MVSALLLLALSGCDDAYFPAHGGGEPAGEGWCLVESTVASACVTCHSAAAPLGDLDLETDLAGTLAGDSPTTGLPFIVPSDPDGSFFFRKLTGELSAGEGGVMPPTGPLDAATIDGVRAWIADGAEVQTDCAGGGNPTGRFHPAGWALPDEHGLAAKLQTLQCTTCHGEDLTGDLGVSCDSCHGTPETRTAWRTDCTWCHGADGHPGPPRQIDGSLTSDDAAFPAHRVHTRNSPLATTYACDTCHVFPDDVLTAGHVFVGDDTPGVAEVVSSRAVWDGASCQSSCHGPTPVAADAGPMVCGDCHPGPGDDPEALGGEHERHLDEGIGCHECHDTAAPNGTIAIRLQHARGTVDVALPAGMTQTGAACTGTCHGESHNARVWND